MLNLDEKRTTRRVRIPEAKVYYKKDEGFEFFRKLSGPMPMKDLGMGGICFEVENGLEWGDLFYGDPLYLEIIMPDKKKIQVKGTVRWISGSIDSESSFIGLEFAPFGIGSRSNKGRLRKRLEDFTGDYN